jgi:hypothetical protein
MEVESPPRAHDLLRFPLIRRLVLWGGFPALFQWLILAAAIAVLAGGGERLVWALWWPLLLAATIALGRAWCAVCPLELVSSTCERLAASSSLPRFDAPRRAAGVGVALLALLLLAPFAGLGRAPGHTAWLLAALLGLAALSGLLLRHRAFCRVLCPLSEFLAVFGSGGALAVRVGLEEFCDRCRTEDCTGDKGCPSLLVPPELHDSRDCLLCAQCIKACTSGNLRLYLRRPFPSNDLRPVLASWPTTAFVMMFSGFVLWQTAVNWRTAETLLLAVPRRLAVLVPTADWRGWLDGVWALLVFPYLLWFVMGWLVRLLGGRGNTWNGWRRLAAPAAWVIASAELTLGLRRLVPHVPLLPIRSLSVAGAGIIGVGFLTAIREARMARFRDSAALGVPLAALSVIFGYIVWNWS